MRISLPKFPKIFCKSLNWIFCPVSSFPVVCPVFEAAGFAAIILESLAWIGFDLDEAADCWFEAAAFVLAVDTGSAREAEVVLWALEVLFLTLLNSISRDIYKIKYFTDCLKLSKKHQIYWKKENWPA